MPCVEPSVARSFEQKVEFRDQKALSRATRSRRSAALHPAHSAACKAGWRPSSAAIPTVGLTLLIAPLAADCHTARSATIDDERSDTPDIAYSPHTCRAWSVGMRELNEKNAAGECVSESSRRKRLVEREGSEGKGAVEVLGLRGVGVEQTLRTAKGTRRDIDEGSEVNQVHSPLETQKREGGTQRERRDNRRQRAEGRGSASEAKGRR
jgi:hypothetical protein